MDYSAAKSNKLSVPLVNSVSDPRLSFFEDKLPISFSIIRTENVNKSYTVSIEIH